MQKHEIGLCGPISQWPNFSGGRTSQWPDVLVTPIFKVSATYSEEEIGPAGVQVDRQLDK